MKRLSWGDPNYREIKDRVGKQFSKDFNNIPLGVVEKYYDGSLEIGLYIIIPSSETIIKEWFDDCVDADEIKEEYNQEQGMYYLDDRITFDVWLYENYKDKAMDYYHDKRIYPSWGTLFEATSRYVSELIEDHVDDLYEMGIGVIQGKGDLDNMLFIDGAGYDFYEQHWIPMYRLFGWIDEDLLKGK